MEGLTVALRGLKPINLEVNPKRCGRPRFGLLPWDPLVTPKSDLPKPYNLKPEPRQVKAYEGLFCPFNLVVPFQRVCLERQGFEVTGLNMSDNWGYFLARGQFKCTLNSKPYSL